MEACIMLDLWYSESHADDAKFSIRVKEHLYSEKHLFNKSISLRVKLLELFSPLTVI